MGSLAISDISPCRRSWRFSRNWKRVFCHTLCLMHPASASRKIIAGTRIQARLADSATSTHRHSTRTRPARWSNCPAAKSHPISAQKGPTLLALADCYQWCTLWAQVVSSPYCSRSTLASGRSYGRELGREGRRKDWWCLTDAGGRWIEGSASWEQAIWMNFYRFDWIGRIWLQISVECGPPTFWLLSCPRPTPSWLPCGQASPLLPPHRIACRSLLSGFTANTPALSSTPWFLLYYRTIYRWQWLGYRPTALLHDYPLFVLVAAIAETHHQAHRSSSWYTSQVPRTGQALSYFHVWGSFECIFLERLARPQYAVDFEFLRYFDTNLACDREWQ